MTSQVNEPIVEQRGVLVGKPANLPLFYKAATKPQQEQSKSKAIGIAAILAMALYLSAQSNLLFFKELSIACAIIGLALLTKILGRPATKFADPNGFDPRLN
jgi:hypothetical protein